MKNEHHRARIKGIVGFITVAFSVLIFHFGSKENLGYMDDYPVLAMFVVGVMLVYGCVLVGAWFQCLADYNDKHRF